MKSFKHYVMFLFLLAISISSIYIVSKASVYEKEDTIQEVRTAEKETAVSTNAAMAVSSSALVKADCTHIFYDYEYKNPVKDEVVIYANGGTVKEGEQKNNYKTKVLYTDILASYSYTVNTKGTIKPAAGKVITGFTTSSELPVIVKGKIVDKEAQKIAKAKIKNGQITITAQKIPGLVYLWVIDTGKQGVYECCPVNVLAAPSKVTIYDIPDDSSSFSSSTKQYKKDNIEIGSAARIYLYPSYKDGGINKKAEDASFSVEVADKAKNSFIVAQDVENPYCFIVTASALNNGKKTSGKITFTCKQNGKKAVFTATAIVPKFNKKSLVAYFSATGTTRTVAKRIADIAGADLYEIEPQEPYTSADLNYNNPNSRVVKEHENPSVRPAIGSSTVNLDDYEVIFLGYPIWWGEAPAIIHTFLESYQWNSKTIVPFCTAISSNIGSSGKNLEPSAVGNPVWLSGRRLERNISKKEVENWISKLDIS